MISIPRRVLFSALALGLLLFATNLWLQRNSSLKVSDTSFGVAGDGYKAAYDLLSELNISVARSYLSPEHASQERMMWLVMPDFLDPIQETPKADASDLMEWIRGGGTAVVFGDAGSEWKRLGLEAAVSVGGNTSTIRGEFAPVAREIPISKLVHFDKAATNAKVRLTADGEPFAMDMAVGSGRLIAIADGRFLLNSNLDNGDGSVLLVDLVHALGAPVFDEHCHGLVAPVSSLAVLAYPRLLTVLGIALVTVLLWIAEQHSWPVRALDDRQGPAPSLASFVDSLGELYSRANDPRAAFRAYRASFLRRIRRQVSPRTDVSEKRLIERLTRDRSLSNETRRWLTGGEIPGTENELVNAVRALESCPSLSHEPGRS
ncbi:MAG TPA: DUF4350 domain-containing protein [Candidatus Binataceae bacterium]|nr:DUF4350 domain-containing protein [Candidatus Binataceae bacterium]